jgi:hypothetical protein
MSFSQNPASFSAAEENPTEEQAVQETVTLVIEDDDLEDDGQFDEENDEYEYDEEAMIGVRNRRRQALYMLLFVATMAYTAYDPIGILGEESIRNACLVINI